MRYRSFIPWPLALAIFPIIIDPVRLQGDISTAENALSETSLTLRDTLSIIGIPVDRLQHIDDVTRLPKIASQT